MVGLTGGAGDLGCRQGRRMTHGGNRRHRQTQGVAHGQGQLVGCSDKGGMLKAGGLDIVQGIVLIVLDRPRALRESRQRVAAAEQLQPQLQAAGLGALVTLRRDQQRTGHGTAVAGIDISAVLRVIQV